MHSNPEQLPESRPSRQHSRRRILATLSATGIGSLVFQRALADETAKSLAVTKEQIEAAEWVAGITLSDDQRISLLNELKKVREDGETIRSIKIDYDTLPAFRFDPEMVDPESVKRSSGPRPWLREPSTTKGSQTGDSSSGDASAKTADGTFLSWLSIRELGQRLRSRSITAVQLAEHCLAQLEKHNSKLNCVVTQTRDLAMKQAEQADRELVAGMDRGPLHGIPWGAKDLIAVAGYPTTWGAPQFKNQTLPSTATVARKLEEAGAVLVAKLSLGALAMGDQWFNGQTKNPWNPEQGSSGSSAGSASAVAAGLIPFAIGSETLGSIVSPTRRCGVMGLRPTFGRVSRAGCMALSWTMDKLGPIARSTDDCGLVLAAIQGRDDGDPTAVDRWFAWPRAVDLSAVRIGKVTNSQTSPAEQAALDAIVALGAKLVEVELPREIPEWPLTTMLDVEAASAFEPLTRSGNLEGINAWGNIFQRSHFVTAVDFLHAARARYRLMKQMVDVFAKVDCYVGGGDLGITNLTGHPTLSIPVMMQDMKPQIRPICCTLTAGLFDEATLLAVGAEIEKKVDVLKFHPTLG